MRQTDTLDRVWVFNGARSAFPSGVFSSRALAETWIRQHALTGCLTTYPLDCGMYEYALQNHTFVPTKEAHSTALFVGQFSGGGMEHFHYEDGRECGAPSTTDRS